METAVFCELDLHQLFNTWHDPRKQRNLQENLGMAKALDRELLGYLDRMVGKTYRPLLSPVFAGH